jgi:hypothetical protein
MHRYFGILVISLYFCNCEAPRHNPLDPKNDDYRFGMLSGQVQTYRVPHQPIASVDIYWENMERFAQTDNEGRFNLRQLDQNDGWLFFDADAYFNDSLFIEWESSEIIEVEHYLNAKPTLDSLVFYSSILNLYNDLQLIRLSIQTRISDPDNDLDTVFVCCPGLDVRVNLDYDLESRFFVRELSMQDLGINSAEAVIGHTFNIHAKDRLSNNLQLSSSQIKRIIKEQVNLKSPGGHEIVSPTPVLRWEPVSPGFPLEYRIEIYTDEMNLVWQKEHIPANTSSLTVDISLPPDKYRWAVWIIDEFQNRSRSKYKTFEVQTQ